MSSKQFYLVTLRINGVIGKVVVVASSVLEALQEGRATEMGPGKVVTAISAELKYVGERTAKSSKEYL